MSRSIYFSAADTPSYMHELMYRYDSPFSCVNDSQLEDKIAGKSAYDLAVENGFQGTIEDWLNSLKGQDGQTPYIGENGHWFIGDVDTGISAGEHSCEHDIISNPEIDEYFNHSGLIDGGDYIDPISREEIDEYFSNQDKDSIMTKEDIDNLFN